MTQTDRSCLSSIVIELTSLGCFGDSRHGSNVDHVSGFASLAYGFGCCEKGEEGKGGEVVGGGVDSVGG
jgi:hypothetical protein